MLTELHNNTALDAMRVLYILFCLTTQLCFIFLLESHRVEVLQSRRQLKSAFPMLLLPLETLCCVIAIDVLWMGCSTEQFWVMLLEK